MAKGRYDDFLYEMELCARYVSPALTFALGSRFEQNYPAGGPHVDGSAYYNNEVEDTWRKWQRSTLRWRDLSEARKKERGLERS